MTRLQRFRAFMAGMNPTADPAVAVRNGMYVERPGETVWSTLQRRLEVDPVSSHLVLGGIGSGKTSELLKATAALQTSLAPEGDHVEYCDVSRAHHLEAPARSGILFSIAGERLSKALEERNAETSKEVAAAVESLRRYARGSGLPTADELLSSLSATRHVPGRLVPPPKVTPPSDLGGRVADLETVLASCPGERKHAIFLFDSLDRLPAPETFVALVRDDLRAFKAAGIGAIVVGPIRYVAGQDRGLAELFDHTHFQLSVDRHDEDGREFLCDVLRRRASEAALLSEAVLLPLAEASGGVLRDLITLAKRAAEEAYTAGSETVTLRDVERASDAFGRGLAVGLDDEQLMALRIVHDTGKFVVRGDRELSLLETRRVLIYPGNRFVVHPSLGTVLGMETGIPF